MLGKSTSILLVSDTEMASTVVASMYARLGYERFIRVHGEEHFFRLLLSGDPVPGLIHFDVSSPDSLALSLCKKFLASSLSTKNFKNTPIVMITTEKNSKSDILKMGVDLCLIKPLTFHALKSGIEKIVRVEKAVA